jgi:hypothetical protein
MVNLGVEPKSVFMAINLLASAREAGYTPAKSGSLGPMNDVTRILSAIDKGDAQAAKQRR